MLFKGSEESGDEFRATVRGDMLRDSVLGEHMSDEQHSKVFRCAVDCHRNEYALLGESVNNHKD